MTTAKTFQTNFAHLITAIPDFPKPGILFRDINPLLGNAAGFALLVDLLAEQVSAFGADAVIALESRGFLCGAPVAYKLGMPLVLVRKAGKLPGKVRKVSYLLEYGESVFEMQTAAPLAGKKVVIIDDLLATGGTASAAIELVRLSGGSVVGGVFAIELGALSGRKQIAPVPVASIVVF